VAVADDDLVSDPRAGGAVTTTRITPPRSGTTEPSRRERLADAAHAFEERAGGTPRIVLTALAIVVGAVIAAGGAVALFSSRGEPLSVPAQPGPTSSVPAAPPRVATTAKQRARTKPRAPVARTAVARPAAPKPAAGGSAEASASASSRPAGSANSGSPSQTTAPQPSAETSPDEPEVQKPAQATGDPPADTQDFVFER
jgi:hypothetical protein